MQRARPLVAAVCFRILSTGVEFLLVRTHRARWTFPKGGHEPGLTHAQSAALEAYEEAGVHGRIEEIAFMRYKLRKRPKNGTQETHDFVRAHLCEVLRLEDAQEANRTPTWFPAGKAKRRLAQGRTEENAAELSRVVDRAVARIRRFPNRSVLANDSLLKVRFEAYEVDASRLLEAVLARSHERSYKHSLHGVVSGRADVHRGKVLQLRPPHITRD